jgi:hypothetical protein
MEKTGKHDASAPVWLDRHLVETLDDLRRNMPLIPSRSSVLRELISTALTAKNTAATAKKMKTASTGVTAQPAL